MRYSLHTRASAQYPATLSVTTGCCLLPRPPDLSTYFFFPALHLSDTPGCHYPHRRFAPALLRQVNAMSSSSPEVEFKINHLKQSMRIISTPRPSYTNTGPLVVYLFFSSPPSLPFSLLFPNWCGIHGWSATVISIHLFPTFAWLPFPCTTARARARRLECGAVARTRPAETVDANFANDISAEVIKASAERGRKHPLSEVVVMVGAGCC